MAVPGQKLVQICFLVIVGLSTISCLSRPDYNLPLFAFLWWQFFNIPVDRRKRHQIYLLIFVAITCIQDLVYLLYWPGKWFSNEWFTVSDSSERLHIIILLCGLIELILKVLLIAFVLLPRDNNLIFCKTDEYDEFEITTYHQTPPGPSVYTRVE